MGFIKISNWMGIGRSLTAEWFTYLESSHHEWHNDIPLLLSHLGRDGQQHQHVVALGHSHGVQVGKDVGASDLA